MMNYVFIGIAVSIGWHMGKLLYKLVEEVMFTRLLATEWYAVLCKKQSRKFVPPMNEGMLKEIPYRKTSIGFKLR